MKGAARWLGMRKGQRSGEVKGEGQRQRRGAIGNAARSCEIAREARGLRWRGIGGWGGGRRARGREGVKDEEKGQEGASEEAGERKVRGKSSKGEIET